MALIFGAIVYESGIVFTEEDMQKFCKTFHNFAREDKIFDNIDGTGESNQAISVLNWAELAKFDKSILRKCLYCFEEYDIALTAQYYQEDWWGTVMLGLSRLALCQSNFE